MAVKLFARVVLSRSSYFPEQFVLRLQRVYTFCSFTKQLPSLQNFYSRRDDTASTVSVLLYSEPAAATTALPVIAGCANTSGVFVERIFVCCDTPNVAHFFTQQIMLFTVP